MARHPLPSFDLYLLPRPGEALDSGALAAALSREPHLRPDPVDPDRYVYVRRDTGVFFPIVLAPGLVRRKRPPSPYGDGEGTDGGDGVERPADEDASPSPESGAEEQRGGGEDDDGAGGIGADGTSGDEAGDAGEEDVDASHPVEVPPVSIHVPCLVPTFFLLEALDFASRVAGVASLHLEHGEESHPPGADGREGDAARATEAEGRDPQVTVEALFPQWRSANAALIERVGSQVDVVVWPAEKAHAWWAYGSIRARLQDEFAAEGVTVPVLQLARIAGELKTLCIWNVREPTALPRSDLVLLRTERERKGLFRTRRVIEEGLVEAERLWHLLAPCAEIRREPVEILIFREARTPPLQLAAELDRLRLDPVEGAKRTEFLGVIDFQP